MWSLKAKKKVVHTFRKAVCNIKMEEKAYNITLESVARRTVPSSRIKGCWMFTSIPGSRRPVCLFKT